MTQTGALKSIGFGAILWDDIPESGAISSGSCAQNIGGSVFNVLVHLRNFGHKSFMVSAIGDDDLGRKTINTIEDMGVEKDFIAIVPEETCLVSVAFDSSGFPHYSSPENVSWDNITLSEDQHSVLSEMAFDYLVFGTLEQRDPRSRATLRRILENGSFRNVFVDITLRKYYSKELLDETMRCATILKMNKEEALEVDRLFGFGEERMEKLIPLLAREFKSELVCVTGGSKGAWVGNSSQVIHCRPYKTRICDTVGCGDAFSAGFIFKHSQGDSIEECCDFGNRFAALIASKRSSCPDYDLGELDAFVEYE